MSRGWLGIVLLLSLGVNLGLVGTALAWRKALDRGSEGDRRFDLARERLADRPGARIAVRLGLDRARSERFVEAHRRMAVRTMAARREIGRLRIELRRAVAARVPDRTGIDGLLAELSAAESALNGAVVEGILESRATLEPGEAREYLRLLEQLGPPGSGFDRRGLRGGEAPRFLQRFEGEPRPRRDDPPPPGP